MTTAANPPDRRSPVAAPSSSPGNFGRPPIDHGVNDNPEGKWPWIVCAVLGLATLLNYMDRQALAVTLPTLKQSFNLTEDRIGRVEASFGYAFAAGSLIFGWLADRFGPRYLYPAALAGWSFAGIATSLAGQPAINQMLESPGDPAGTAVYRWLLICRIVLGVCEAGHWPCALLTVRAVLGTKHRTLGNGILQSGASLGAIIVPLYILAADKAGQPWQFSFWSIGLVGLLWVPVWLTLVRGRNLRVPKSEAVAAIPAASAAETSSDLFRRIITAGIVVATLTISWQFLRAWLALFLQDFHKFSKESTQFLMSGYFLSSDVGCILAGVLVARLAARGMSASSARTTGFFVFTLLTACGAIVPYAGNGPLMIALLFVTGAGILGLHPFYYSMTQELSSRHMGSISGILAALGWIVSSTFQFYIGDQIKATKSYEVGLLMVGLAPVIGLLAMAVLWPKDRVMKAQSH